MRNRASFELGLRLLCGLAGPLLAADSLAADPRAVDPRAVDPLVVDLRVTPPENGLRRAHGHTGTGTSGLPVAGGVDSDGDGHGDFAFAAFRADPLGRSDAGEIYLIFGDGTIEGTLDTGLPNADVLTLQGALALETAGNEIWLDDVTGDGLGDLLIARQNHTPDPARVGAGALTIVVGDPALRERAARLEAVDLRDPPDDLALTTIVGAAAAQRLGIWVRSGDVTGDGIADLAVGADQTTELGESHRGAVYVIRGGPQLAQARYVDLAHFGSTALSGDIARLTPPPLAAEYHFGATLQIADLDGNGRGEVMAAAALARAGAGLRPAGARGPSHASGGTAHGALFIAWDDNFAEPWGEGLAFEVGGGPGHHSVIHGASCNRRFGEEILGGLDYDGNGSADLFVGDIQGNCGPLSRPAAGSGHIFFDAVALKGRDVDLAAPPPELAIAEIYGARANDIAADTAVHGDFDGDGFGDLGIASPHAAPASRASAGVVHILFGQRHWPRSLDLAALSGADLRVTEVWGAHGDVRGDAGDTIGYSAATGDVDGDGRPDLICNEMVGNGLQPDSVDVGNLIVLSARALAPTRVPSLGVGAGLLLLTLGASVLARRRRPARGQAVPRPGRRPRPGRQASQPQ